MINKLFTLSRRQLNLNKCLVQTLPLYQRSEIKSGHGLASGITMNTSRGFILF